jgi:FkbM family methyltransferase
MCGEYEVRIRMTDRNKRQFVPLVGTCAASLVLLANGGMRFGTYIDVGCAEGLYGLALWHAGLLRDATIINIDANSLYEPSLQRIQSAIGGHYRICAVGEQTGTVEMHSSAHPYWASAAEVTDRYWETVNVQIGETITVPCFTLDDLIGGIAPKPPHLLKLDIQGLEARVLRGGPRTLADTAVIVCEVNVYAFHEINSIIEQAGFSLYDLTHLNRSHDHKLRWFDAVYLHRSYSHLNSPKVWTDERNEQVKELQEQRRKTVMSEIDAILAELSQPGTTSNG